MVIPLHCGHDVLLLTVGRRKETFFHMGIRKKMFATQCSPEKETVFYNLSLSRTTVTRRIVFIDLFNQLRNKAKEFEITC
jgi:hypothetical protein